MHKPSLCRTAAVLAGLALLGAAAPVTAQQSPPGGPAPTASATATSPSEKADELYRKARVAIAAKEWPRAFEMLWSAYQLKKSHDIAANLGHVELRLGKYQAAAEHLTVGLSLYPANGNEEGRKRISELLAEAKKEVGTLKLTVTPPEALVNVAGQRIEPEKLKGEIFVEPGEMRVEAGGLPTHRPVIQSVKVAKGQVVEVSLVLAPIQTVPTASATATSAPTASPGPNKAIVIGGSALAGASLIAGAVLFGVASGMQADLQRDAPKNEDGSLYCVANPPAGTAIATCDEFRDRARNANALGQGGVGLMIAGGALAAGTILYAFWPRPMQAPPVATVMPVATPSGAGLVMTGSF